MVDYSCFFSVCTLDCGLWIAKWTTIVFFLPRSSAEGYEEASCLSCGLTTAFALRQRSTTRLPTPAGDQELCSCIFQMTIIFYMPVWITNAENEVCPSSIRRGKGSWRSCVERKEHGEESLQACDREAMTSSFSPPYHLVLTRSQNTQLPTTKHKVTGSASKQSAYLT